MAGLWFKFWASNFLTDGDVDALPDAAVVLLVKMRCLCCIEGACPVSPSEVARKTRTSEDVVWAMLPRLCKTFFERRGDLLFDVQQEQDAARTERGKRGAFVANSRRSGSRSGGTSVALSDAKSPRAASVASSDGASDAQLPFATSDGASDGASGGTSDAQKLEVRSKKQEGSVDVVGSEEGYTAVSPVETVEKSENVPVGTLLHNLKKKSESAFHLPSSDELERRRQQQLQNLHEWEKRRAKATPTPTAKAEQLA